VKYIISILFALVLGGCSDAERGKIEAIGHEAYIQCWSAGVKYYEGTSTGKVFTEKESDGWYFVEKGSNQLIRVSGPCVIRN
jgi:hypothetical protein